MKRYVKRMLDSFQRGRRFVAHDIWLVGRPGEELPHGIIIKQIRAVILLVKATVEEALLLRASALTFATMLFIVPFLAFLFYFIQTFQLGDNVYMSLSHKIDVQIKRLADALDYDSMQEEEEATEGEGEQGDGEDENGGEAFFADAPVLQANTAVLTAQMDGGGGDGRGEQQLFDKILRTFVPIFDSSNTLMHDGDYTNPVDALAKLAQQGATNPQAIGITGILFVLSTVFGFLRNVESAFNSIWGVSRARSMFRTLSDYLLITLLLPFVMAVVLGITAALESEAIASRLGTFSTGLRSVQFLVICLTFSMLYYFVPNTKVERRYALLGGFVAGGLWMLCSWGYAKFLFGLARYAVFFSGFALFPLLLMWIFLSWLILLFGALLSFAYQNEKTFAMERLADGASFAYREAVGVRAVMELVWRFQQGLPALSAHEMATAWNVPLRLVNETLRCLVQARLVTECATEPVTFQPARAPETTQVIDIVRAIREAGRDPSLLRSEMEYKPLYVGLDCADPATLTATLGELAMRYDAGENRRA